MSISCHQTAGRASALRPLERQGSVSPGMAKFPPRFPTRPGRGRPAFGQLIEAPIWFLSFTAPVAGQEDVFRLDVPMHDIVAVRIAQRIGHFARDQQCFIQGQLLLPLQPVPQRLNFDEWHRVVHEAAHLPRVEQGQDVWVVEAGGDADFAKEPVGAQRGGGFGAENLEGDRAVVLEVLSEVDGLPCPRGPTRAPPCSGR
jgi:hypothetical protein